MKVDGVNSHLVDVEDLEVIDVEEEEVSVEGIKAEEIVEVVVVVLVIGSTKTVADSNLVETTISSRFVSDKTDQTRKTIPFKMIACKTAMYI